MSSNDAGKLPRWEAWELVRIRIDCAQMAMWRAFGELPGGVGAFLVMRTHACACARTHAHTHAFKLPILPILPKRNVRV